METFDEAFTQMKVDIPPDKSNRKGDIGLNMCKNKNVQANCAVNYSVTSERKPVTIDTNGLSVSNFNDSIHSKQNAHRPVRNDLTSMRRELEGQMRSVKAEVVRLQTQLRDFSTKHFRAMEHLRFVINNRLHAKPPDQATQEQPHDAPYDDDTIGSLPDTAMSKSKGYTSPTHLSRKNHHCEISRSLDEDLTASMPSFSKGKVADDIHAHADWKESVKPIGYLHSCFKRKVS